MPESFVHSELVNALISFVSKEFLENTPGVIRHDAAGRPASVSPPQIDGYIPDLFARIGDRSTVPLIGEAKTVKDLDTKHSTKQIVAFMDYCNTQDSGVFVLGVPWHVVPYARGLLQRLCKRHQLNNVKIVVPDCFPG